MKKILSSVFVCLSFAALVAMNALPRGEETKKPEKTRRATRPDAVDDSWPWTTASPEFNLKGRMFTLSWSRGSITFFPSYYMTRFLSSRTSSTLQTTTEYPASTYPQTSTAEYSTDRYPYWTTAPPSRGMSICVAYLTDFQETTDFSLLKLNPSLTLQVRNTGTYSVSFDPYGYNQLYFKPNINLWPGIPSNMWIRVCLIIDAVNNVGQMFSGSKMSIRKILPYKVAWPAVPVVEVSGFSGQITDLQMWDYPIRSKQVQNFMTAGYYGTYRGSVLTWFDIGFSASGYTLLEDSYDFQDQKQISGKLKRPLAVDTKTLIFNSIGKENEEKQEI